MTSSTIYQMLVQGAGGGATDNIFVQDGLYTGAGAITGNPGYGNAQIWTCSGACSTASSPGAGVGQNFYGLIDETSPPEPTDSISITYPAAGATSTTPDHFIVQYQTTATSTGSPYQIVLNTYTNPDYPHTTALKFVPGSTSATSTTLVSGQGFPPNSTYWEQAFLKYWYDANTVVTLASSTPQQFTTGATSYVAPATSTVYVPPTAADITTSTPVIQVTCDPDSSFFAYSLCNMLQALFIPSPDSLQHLTDIKDLVATKPPIGWFNIIAADLGAFNASSTPVFVLLSSVMLTNFNGFITPIDEGVGILIVLLSLMWVYHRARKLKI